MLCRRMEWALREYMRFEALRMMCEQGIERVERVGELSLGALSFGPILNRKFLFQEIGKSLGLPLIEINWLITENCGKEYPNTIYTCVPEIETYEFFLLVALRERAFYADKVQEEAKIVRRLSFLEDQRSLLLGKGQLEEYLSGTDIFIQNSLFYARTEAEKMKVVFILGSELRGSPRGQC